MLEDDLIREILKNSDKVAKKDIKSKIEDLTREKEYYRKDAIYWETTAKRIYRAYKKLKEEKENEEKAK